MTPPAAGSGPSYRDLHATVVDAIKYVTVNQSLEDAADEALVRLRDAGLPIPAKS